MDLCFSVQLKKSKKRTQILFLLEHKSYQSPGILHQMLDYQTGIYCHQHREKNYPVIPIIVYHGKEKKWRGPLNFQDTLTGLTPPLKRKFRKNILDFTCRMLNIQQLDIPEKVKHLSSRPVLFILQQVWRLNEEKIKQFFILGKGLTEQERKDLMLKAVDYVSEFDKHFSWKVFREIEEKTIKNEEERIMLTLRYSLEREKKKGLEKGRKEGMERGIEKGIEKGREEGRGEGREEGRGEVALKMLVKGMPLSTVEECTGLGQEELEKLKGRL